MRKVLFLLILMLPLTLFSQKDKLQIYTVTGKILDAETKKPIEDATIVFKDKDSIKISCGAITNSRGIFTIEVKEGFYQVSVAFLSYQTKELTISKVTKDINIGNVYLEIDTEYLNEIQVISEKKSLDFKSNKMVFNVEKDISSSGNSATQILNNIPSINVDADGSITLRGQSDVTVMINGRTSTMSKAEALKSLSAGSIEKIEVLTSPGAKYKATSTGIINIILKKGKDEGLNASITTSGGYKDYYGGLLTLNHKSKNINFFTNTSFYNSNPITTATFENEYFENSSTIGFLNEESEFNNKQKGFISTIGTDFYLNKQSTLTTTFNYTDINQNNQGHTHSDFLNTSKQITTSNNRMLDSEFSNEMFEFIVDFKHKFNKEGKELTSYFNFTKDNETSNTNIINTNDSFNDENYIQNNVLKNYIFNITFLNTIGKSVWYTLGYEGEFGSIPFEYSGTSNHTNLDYSENIHSAYLDLEFESGKFYFTSGLRAEFQESTLEYTSLNTKQKTKQEDIFPSASIDYTINDSHSLGISYRAAIQRITPAVLQPYEEKISETSSYIGNEKIEPVDIHMSNLFYSFSGNSFSITPSLFYHTYKKYWENVTYETGEQINGINKLITSPFNVGTLNYYGINISATYKVHNNLNFSGNAFLVNFDQKGVFETINTANQLITKDYNHDNVTGSFSLLTQVKIPTVFDFQINAKHQLASKAMYSIRKARTYASLAINKDIFNKEASIGLTVDDIFLSNITKRERFDSGYFSNSLIENKNRTILLSFTYRFNQSKKDRQIDFDKIDMKPNY